MLDGAPNALCPHDFVAKPGVTSGPQIVQMNELLDIRKIQPFWLIFNDFITYYGPKQTQISTTSAGTGG
jgi:hypothetical protein